MVEIVQQTHYYLILAHDPHLEGEELNYLNLNYLNFSCKLTIIFHPT